MGFRSRRPTHEPLLTTRYKALLLTRARQHFHRAVEDWRHDVWSAESRFQLYWAGERVRLFRQLRVSLDFTCQKRSVQASGFSLVVRG